MRRTLGLLLPALVVLIAFLILSRDREDSGRAPGGSSLKLYWFVPDGMRADPDLFDIYRWAAEGRLPNIKKMMERGSYGFSRPTFPSHTPTNFATLFTGSYPEVHGVNDGPMHTEGNPLSVVSVGGFSSAAKRVEPIWVTLESREGMDVALLSIPGSTPPELKKGITIRGRWGGWGADFHSVTFQEKGDLSLRRGQGKGSRLFFFGPQLTQYIGTTPAEGWDRPPASFSPAREARMEAWGATVFACLLDSADDGQAGYDSLLFSMDRKRTLAVLREGESSGWLPIVLKWKVPRTDPEKDPEKDVDTSFRIKVIKLEPSGSFRVNFFFNNLNRHLTEPPSVAGELLEEVGPMVDFPDNFPPQLIYFPEDKAAFLEEAGWSLDWHREAASFILDRYRPRIFLHDLYTPNQMLTSRWWLGYVDPSSRRYGEVSGPEREQLWKEVHWLYEKLDEIAGRLLERADGETLVVLSSDHGAVPLDRWVRLNNLFSREKLLEFRIDAETGESTIDWERSRAVYLKMHNVYLDPEGLGGNWKRASGPEYERLRSRVKDLLLGLRDENGEKPVAEVLEWERAGELRLLGERTGDLILANSPGYGWNEEMTSDGEVFGTPLVSGYKQAVLPGEVKGMWTPLILVGPGVKKGHFLGPEPVEMVDQYPTVMRLLGLKSPDFVQGRVIIEVLEPPAGEGTP